MRKYANTSSLSTFSEYFRKHPTKSLLGFIVISSTIIYCKNREPIIFQEFVQNHRKKYREAAYINLKYEHGDMMNIAQEKESMSKQLGVKDLEENTEWLEYKRMRKSPNALWSIYNILDIFTFRHLLGLNKSNYHPRLIKIRCWLGLDIKDKMPPLLIIDDIQVLINPRKADNESWDAIYTTLGYLYNLAYEGNAILIFGSSEAFVYKHMLEGNIYMIDIYVYIL